jgi:membrane-associated phospholipid phosphatase
LYHLRDRLGLPIALRRERRMNQRRDETPGSGPISVTKQTLKSEAGPLGRVDPVNPKAAGRAGAADAARRARAATLTVVVGLAGLIASLVVLGSIAEGVRDQEVFALDAWATPFLHGIASPGLNALMWTLTDMGSSMVIVPLFAIVVALLVRARRFGATLFLATASCGALILNATMKLFFERPRPQLPWAQVLPDYSFPSGHTMNGVVFYVALAVIAWSIFGRRVGIASMVLASVLAFGIGVSRIYLGFHYLTDVVGGILAGNAWLLVVGAAFRVRPTWWRWGQAEPQASRGRRGPDGSGTATAA